MRHRDHRLPLTSPTCPRGPPRRPSPLRQATRRRTPRSIVPDPFILLGSPEIRLAAPLAPTPPRPRRLHRKTRREPLNRSPPPFSSRTPRSRCPASTRSRRPPWPASSVPLSPSAPASCSGGLLLPIRCCLAPPVRSPRAAAATPHQLSSGRCREPCSGELRPPHGLPPAPLDACERQPPSAPIRASNGRRSSVSGERPPWFWSPPAKLRRADMALA